MKTRISLTLPQSLKTSVEEAAARQGMTVEQFITRALIEKIGARGVAEFFAKRGENGDPERAMAFLESRPE